MEIIHEKLQTFLNEYKLKKEIQPLVSFLKNTLECKQRISIEISDSLGQQYCRVLVEILNDLDPKGGDESATMEVVCDCLIQQVTVANVRWYILEMCHLLFCLSRQFLSSTNTTMKIKIAKILQTYLIYSSFDGRNLLSQDLVSELFKDLVNILRDNHPQEFYEVSLGLFASLCQIWSQCQDVMNVIDDYQVLRKHLLRFLAADMVKRTTIVYTMTIMFHLCNSDDRLFNKRNIRQTLQVLFNIMLNGEVGWASLYAACLLTEICKSPKTCHLINEYNSLAVSLKESLSQLNTKENIITEKYFEFILTIVKMNSELQHTMMNFITPKVPSISENLWSKDYDEHGSRKDLLDSIIQLVNSCETTISIYSMKLLNIFYMEFISSHQEIKLPKLCLLGEAVHHFFSKVNCNAVLKANIPNKEGMVDLEKASINYLMKHRQELSELLKIKHGLELVTDLLQSGDQWLGLATAFINCTDQIIRDQLESNPIIENMELSKSHLTNKLSCLGVEVFIDLLHFYYRAAEANPSSNVFGERLKVHLEHPKSVIMLAFALSAASQNQITLQRALVLQSVCLHLPDFNVEMMGEKMYRFSSEYSSLNSGDLDLDTPLSIIGGDACSQERRGGYERSSDYNKISNVVTENANGDNCEFRELAISSNREMRTLQPCSISRKPPTCQQSGEGGDTHYTESAARCKFIENTNYNLDLTPIDKLNLDLKVQQIVNKWMEKPELTFGSTEICLLFEHRIQSMQNQEALMEEIISNKTAGLYQAETLLSQYRVKLADAEKEGKRFKNLQLEMESKIEDLHKTVGIQNEKLIELEAENQALLETNALGETQKEDCLSISRKLQEKLAKLADEKADMENSLEHYSKQIEDAYQLIALKDSQISNYSHMTMLINKLTGNKFVSDNGIGQSTAEDSNKSSSVCTASESDSQPHRRTNQSEPCCANNNSASLTTASSPPANQDEAHFSRTISNSDFLQLYRTNSRILRSHK